MQEVGCLIFSAQPLQPKEPAVISEFPRYDVILEYYSVFILFGLIMLVVVIIMVCDWSRNRQWAKVRFGCCFLVLVLGFLYMAPIQAFWVGSEFHINSEDIQGLTIQKMQDERTPKGGVISIQDPVEIDEFVDALQDHTLFVQSSEDFRSGYRITITTDTGTELYLDAFRDTSRRKNVCVVTPRGPSIIFGVSYPSASCHCPDLFDWLDKKVGN